MSKITEKQIGKTVEMAEKIQSMFADSTFETWKKQKNIPTHPDLEPLAYIFKAAFKLGALCALTTVGMKLNEKVRH
jgi:hypothetical protein